MARQIAPGTPDRIDAPQVKVGKIDTTLLDKIADDKIRAANNNFKLYAEALVTSESQKIYDQFKSDPVNLANALGKLPDMLSDLPEDIQAEMGKKIALNNISLVGKAQDNYDRKIREQTKVNAIKVAENKGQSISNDFFNLLVYHTTPEELRRPVDVEIYATNRVNLAEMADMKDDKGNPLFTEKQQAKMKMPSDAILEGFRQFIYRPDLKQLQQWYEDIFQNRDKFIADMGIDSNIYDTMGKEIMQRIRQLKNSDGIKIKTQAMFETAALIKEGLDKTKIEELRKNSNAPKSLVDKAVKLNEEIIKSSWYDVNRSSDPTSALEIMGIVGEIVNDTDTSPDGLERKIEKAITALDTAVQKAPKANLSDSELLTLRDWLSDSITDAGLARNIQMLDVSPWVNSVVEAHKAEREKNVAAYGEKAVEKFESELEAYHAKGKLAPIEKKAQESVLSTTQHGWIQRERSHKLAYNNAKMGLYDVMDYLRNTGDVDGAKNMLSQVKYNYIKTYNSDWIPGSDFDRLQREFDSGKIPTYFHNGIVWKYNGYQNDGAIFEIKL